MTKKFCVKCGHEFYAIGRQVICPDCKAAAEEESKKAAIMRAKKASWNGESVPVRISGRASTVIRRYGKAHDVPFAEALDALLKSTDFFKSVGTKWEAVEPYRSHRRDKHATEAPQEVQAAKQEEVKQEAPQASKQAAKTTSKTAAKKAVKTAAKAKEVKA